MQPKLLVVFIKKNISELLVKQAVLVLMEIKLLQQAAEEWLLQTKKN